MIYDNQPHSKIEELVENDLSEYNQDNPYPKSLTIVEGEFWRHYELGSIYGFVIWNEKDINENIVFRVGSIKEDDEYWFAPIDSMFMDAAWIPEVGRTWNRLLEWYNKHLFSGWRDNVEYGNPSTYTREIISPIVSEIIY